MTDIVERLRAGFQCAESGNRCRTMDAQSGCVCAEAADEIQRLRAALRTVDDEHGYGLPPDTRKMIRAALKTPTPPEAHND